MRAEKMRLLLAENQKQHALAFRQYILKQKDLELVGEVRCGLEAVREVKEKQPDAVIVSLELPEGTAIDFLYQIRMAHLPSPPYVAVLTSTEYRQELQQARQAGMGAVFSRTDADYSPQKVIRFLHRIRDNLNPMTASCKELASIQIESAEEAIRKQISQDLCMLYITPNLRGHYFIKEAVMMVVEAPVNQPPFEMTNRIYPGLAKRFETTKSNVERCIRTALEIAWSKPDIVDMAKKVYPAPVETAGDRPSNREFIYTYAEKFRKNH